MMFKSFIPLYLLALVGIANAAAVNQSAATTGVEGFDEESLPFTPAEVPTWSWNEEEKASTLEARHGGHHHHSNVIDDIKYLIRRNHLEDYCYDVLHWSPYKTTKTAYKTRTKTKEQFSVLKVTATISKNSFVTAYDPAVTVASTITEEVVETLTTSSHATVTETPVETVIETITSTETVQPTATAFTLEARLQSLVDARVPPSTTTATTSTMVPVKRHSVRRPHALRKYADSSIRRACSSIVKKPTKTKYTTKTRTLYRTRTKVHTLHRKVTTTNTLTTTLPPTALPLTSLSTATTTSTSTLIIPLTQTTTIPSTTTSTLTTTTTVLGTATITVNQAATACPSAPEYTRVASWVNNPYVAADYILYLDNTISAEECCMMCFYGFPSCASWTHWPNSKYNSGTNYCGAAIRAKNSAPGGIPEEEKSDKCPNGLGGYTVTTMQNRQEDYVAGKGPCGGQRAGNDA